MKRFTFLELLIVIAILGILVTLLLPSLEKARRAAKMAVCLSNHKQIAAAYHLYSAQNNQVAVSHKEGFDFIGGLSKKERKQGQTHARRLNEYVSSPKVAECPSDKGDNWETKDLTLYEYYGSSYYAGYWGAYDEKSTGPGAQMSVGYSTSLPKIKTFIAAFSYPDKKIMFYNRMVRHSNTFWWLNVEARNVHSKHDPNRFISPNSFIDGSARVIHFYEKERKDKILPRKKSYGDGVLFYEGMINDFGWY